MFVRNSGAENEISEQNKADERTEEKNNKIFSLDFQLVMDIKAFFI